VYEKERNLMVDRLIKQGYIRSKNLERALRTVPRHIFVQKEYWSSAYEDIPLPTANGQTTSAPSIVALMCEASLPFSFLFEIGTGTGYLSSVCALSQPDGFIITAEIFFELALRANKNFQELELSDRVNVIVGDGSRGLNSKLIPDTIVVSAAAREIPKALLDGLKEGGKIIIPVGEGVQELLLVRKINSELLVSSITSCIFVPLLGKYE